MTTQLPAIRIIPFMNFKVFIFLALLTSSFERAHASSGEATATFLEIPVGARPAALGSAYSALATDAYAPVWNPAGLGFISGFQLAGQHLSYLESINHEFVGAAIPLGEGRAFGAAVQYVGYGDIQGRDVFGNATGSYSATDAAYTLSYGQAIGRLALGVSGKWIRSSIAGVSANAYAVDLGTLYTLQDNLSLAFVIRNLGSRVTYLRESNPLPLEARLGVKWDASPHWLLTAEGRYAKEGDPSGHFGVEWSPIRAISIRTGFRTDTLKENNALAGFSTGIGLQVWGQELSYAWVPYGDLGTTQYISLLIRFKGKAQ